MFNHLIRGKIKSVGHKAAAPIHRENAPTNPKDFLASEFDALQQVIIRVWLPFIYGIILENEIVSDIIGRVKKTIGRL